MYEQKPSSKVILDEGFFGGEKLMFFIQIIRIENMLRFVIVVHN